ncbi:hypothetical protein J6590_049210, partial [Homalodisca vitripennis]
FRRLRLVKTAKDLAEERQRWQSKLDLAPEIQDAEKQTRIEHPTSPGRFQGCYQHQTLQLRFKSDIQLALRVCLRRTILDSSIE